MRSTDAIEKYVKTTTVKTDPQVNKAVLDDLLDRMDRDSGAPCTAPPHGIRRTIMTGKLTKFAAAAAMIIATIGSVYFLNNAVTPAYSMEQTIQAGRDVRYLHFSFYASLNTDIADKEAWLEYDDGGQIKNIRVDWYNQPAGDMTMVWKEGRTQYWTKKSKTLRFFEDEIYTEKMVSFARRFDPTRMVKTMYDLEKQGKVKVQIHEPSDITQPIMLTCTWLPNTYIVKGTSPQMREVVHIDRFTKLVTSVKVYERKDGNYEGGGVWKYTDYAASFKTEIFDLDTEAPADVKRLDLMCLDIGMERTDLTDEEIAIKVVRSFLQALIEKNYETAVKIYGYENPDDREHLMQNLEKLNLIRIIEIGDPVAPRMDSRGKLRVPCRVESEENGQVIVWEIENMFAQRVIGHSNRWHVEAEFIR